MDKSTVIYQLMSQYSSKDSNDSRNLDFLNMYEKGHDGIKA